MFTSTLDVLRCFGGHYRSFALDDILTDTILNAHRFLHGRSILRLFAASFLAAQFAPLALSPTILCVDRRQ